MKIFSVGKTRPVTFALGEYFEKVQAGVKALTAMQVSKRLWEKDPSLWEATEDISNSLGWLGVAEEMQDRTKEIVDFAGEIKEAGYTNAVLLGMGGSSLGADVLRRTVGTSQGYPILTVLDTTCPETVKGIEDVIDLEKTLFIVSSKSGTTIEPISLLKYFKERVAEKTDKWAANFIAITDPGSELNEEAKKDGFRRIFLNPPDIGGRFSVMSYFGLVPAAISGVDIETLLTGAHLMTSECGPNVSADHNPALCLGSALATLAKEGRDKVTFIIAHEFAALSGWLEQLLAESTGKLGQGFVPIVNEPKGAIGSYGEDRVFVQIGSPFVEEHDLELLHYLEKAGHPIISIRVDDPTDIGGEFLRWELATATAGIDLKINPFDQPDVESAKEHTRDLLAGVDDKNKFEARMKSQGEKFRLFMSEELPVDSEAPASHLKSLFRLVKKTDYIGLLAYLDPRDEEVVNVLSWMRGSLRDSLHTSTQLGFGPSYLHSTGQLHKGGGDGCIFLAFTHNSPSTGGDDIPVPGTNYTLRSLISAQALGDLAALAAKGRRVAVFDIDAPYEPALEEAFKAIKDALEEV